MDDGEFEEYLAPCGDDQVAGLRFLRDLVQTHGGGLDESVNTGRWLEGFVFYSTAGQMVYAMGPKGKSKTTFHMMPFYGSTALQERHGPALAPFLTGKSCIAFRNVTELPTDALVDIVARGTSVMRRMLEEHATPRSSPRPRGGT